MARFGALLAIAAAMCSVDARAFIYDVTMLKKWDSARGRYQKVVAYSDFHDQPTSLTQQTHAAQGAYIKTLLSTVNKRATKVIVEDLCAVNDRGCVSCGNFCIKPRGGILGGLTDTCQAAGVSVCNVEFRYCRVTALGPVFNGPQNQDPATFSSTKTITVGALRDEIAATIREINGYYDGALLRQVYDQGIVTITKHVQELAFARESNASVARYITTHTNQATKLGTLKKLLTFDSELVDYKILHQIAAAGDKEVILIFAGGSHCDNVCRVLTMLGYQRVQRAPERPVYLGAGVPKPLNLAMLTFGALMRTI